MKLRTFTLALLATVMAAPWASAEQFAPYGTARLDMHVMPATDVVFDVNYADPRQLNLLYGFVRSTVRHTRGKVVVVTHGPELRAFAKENYEQYQGEVDRMAELARDFGVEFRMCNDALRAAGFVPQDMHGIVTVVPSGFSELAHWQARGYRYSNPIPLEVKDVRYLDQPGLKQ
jgi:intracellular sulfur oxidation DsrE/DsrF family protein